MFDIAFSELVVIGILALVVLGPRRLPEVARTAGRWVSRIRRFVDDVKRDMDVELRKDELAELRKVKEQLTETHQLFEQTATSTLASLPDGRESILAPPAGAAATTPPEAKPPAARVTAGRRTRSGHAKKKSTQTKTRKHGRSTRKSR